MVMFGGGVTVCLRGLLITPDVLSSSDEDVFTGGCGVVGESWGDSDCRDKDGAGEA